MVTRTSTKQALEYSMKELMFCYPFDKITVSDICDNCGVKRQIFYYHFKDKFDLVNWIYQTNANNIVNALIDTNSWEKVLYGILVYLAENKKHYINAFSVEGQNSFSDFLFSYTYKLNKFVAMLHMGNKEFSKSQLFSLEFYCHGAVSIAKQWAKKDMYESPDYMAERLTYNIPIDLKDYFNQISWNKFKGQKINFLLNKIS